MPRSDKAYLGSRYLFVGWEIDNLYVLALLLMAVRVMIILIKDYLMY